MRRSRGPFRPSLAGIKRVSEVKSSKRDRGPLEDNDDDDDDWVEEEDEEEEKKRTRKRDRARGGRERRGRCVSSSRQKQIAIVCGEQRQRGPWGASITCLSRLYHSRLFLLSLRCVGSSFPSSPLLTHLFLAMSFTVHLEWDVFSLVRGVFLFGFRLCQWPHCALRRSRITSG